MSAAFSSDKDVPRDRGAEDGGSHHSRLDGATPGADVLAVVAFVGFAHTGAIRFPAFDFLGVLRSTIPSFNRGTLK